MYEYRAQLQRVVDGDTLHCRVDLGCDVRLDLTIRLNAINCPEMSTPEGVTAKAYAEQWFADHCPDGMFALHTIKDKREKYGRYLGVIVSDDSHVLNDDLVSSGNAVTKVY